MEKKIVDHYVNEAGDKPFLKWLDKLDVPTQAIITEYVGRVAKGGSLKNIKSLKDGVFEIKIFFGPGLRVYFANDGKKIILLLIGGDKKSQTSDIQKAKEYWRNYGQKK